MLLLVIKEISHFQLCTSLILLFTGMCELCYGIICFKFFKKQGTPIIKISTFPDYHGYG